METPEVELDDACGEAPFDVWDFFGVALQKKKKHPHTHNQTKTSLSHEVSLTAVLITSIITLLHLDTRTRQTNSISFLIR